MKPDDITDEEWEAFDREFTWEESAVALNALRDERVRADERARVEAILRQTGLDFAGSDGVHANVVLATVRRRLREGWTP